ncbi:WXG100 family type VII secretion target [Nocardia sp. NPDC004068]|uniref:WXG100 family type VII secretion target n=1 Tax=Nocardia sp. NPDC004068 TaxID=3364303 RepID=UPI0036C82D29
MSESGGSPRFAIESEEVRALGRAAFEVARQCREGLSALQTDVRDLLDEWRGNNADAFGGAWDELHTGAVEVWDALAELAARLGVTVDMVDRTDQANAAGTRMLDL